MDTRVATLLQEYDEILTGRRKLLSTAIFVENKKQNERVIGQFLRIIFKYYICWTPSAAFESFSRETLNHFKLNQLLYYIEFPKEFSMDSDPYYLVSLAYPSLRLTQRERCLKIYTKILHGDLKKYPKGFFTGTDGEENAKTCLRYAVSERLSFHSLFEMYEYFDKSGSAFLKKNFLFQAFSQNWRHPAEYLYDALPNSQKNKRYLYYFMFPAKWRNQYEWAKQGIGRITSYEKLIDSALYKTYLKTLEMPEAERMGGLLRLWGEDCQDKKAITLCLKGVLCSAKELRSMSMDESLDFFISPEGEAFFIKHGFKIPMEQAGGPIALYEKALSQRTKEECREEIEYAKKKYAKRQKAPASDSGVAT